MNRSFSVSKLAHLTRLCRMDPTSNSLLRTFECSFFDLKRFTSSNWEPPVKLTTHERDIVDKVGSVLLQGRGGTGKTLCLISRSVVFVCMLHCKIFVSAQTKPDQKCAMCLIRDAGFTKIIWRYHIELHQNRNRSNRPRVPKSSLFPTAFGISIKV